MKKRESDPKNGSPARDDYDDGGGGGGGGGDDEQTEEQKRSTRYGFWKDVLRSRSVVVRAFLFASLLWSSFRTMRHSFYPSLWVGIEKQHKGGVVERRRRPQLLPECASSRPYARDEHPSSSDVDSAFNCDPSDPARGSFCRYVYPAEFFDPDCGVGRSFRYLIDDLEVQRHNGTLWRSGPYIAFHTVTLEDFCFVNETISRFDKRRSATKDTTLLHKTLVGNGDGKHDVANVSSSSSPLGQSFPRRHERCLKERITFVHMHKAGGTSIMHVLMALNGRPLPDLRDIMRPHRKRKKNPPLKQKQRPGRPKFARPNQPPQRPGRRRALAESTPARSDLRARAITAPARIGPASSGSDKDSVEARSSSSSPPPRIYFKTYKHHWPNMRPRNVAESNVTGVRALTNATRYPSDGRFGPQHTVVFTTVRDPVERFVSSVGQAVRKNSAAGDTIVKACRISDGDGGTNAATAALRCVAEYLVANGVLVELHFVPMALDLAFSTLYQHVPVAVFHLDDLSRLLAYLGRENTRSRVRNAKGTKDRSNVGVMPVFRNATADDLDDLTLEIVCRLYEVDVLLMRTLGFETPRCDRWLGTMDEWRTNVGYDDAAAAAEK